MIGTSHLFIFSMASKKESTVFQTDSQVESSKVWGEVICRWVFHYKPSSYWVPRFGGRRCTSKVGRLCTSEVGRLCTSEVACLCTLLLCSLYLCNMILLVDASSLHHHTNHHCAGFFLISLCVFLVFGLHSLPSAPSPSPSFFLSLSFAQVLPHNAHNSSHTSHLLQLNAHNSSHSTHLTQHNSLKSCVNVQSVRTAQVRYCTPPHPTPTPAC